MKVVAEVEKTCVAGRPVLKELLELPVWKLPEAEHCIAGLFHSTECDEYSETKLGGTEELFKKS